MLCSYLIPLSHDPSVLWVTSSFSHIEPSPHSHEPPPKDPLWSCLPPLFQIWSYFSGTDGNKDSQHRILEAQDSVSTSWFSFRRLPRMPEGLPSHRLWTLRAHLSKTSLMLVFKITFSFWNILDLHIRCKEGTEHSCVPLRAEVSILLQCVICINQGCSTGA